MGASVLRRWVGGAVLVAALLLTPVGASATAELPPFPSNATADYQLGGGYPVAAELVVRDWREQPLPGAYNVCYLNPFQTQPEHRKRWRKQHPELLLRDRVGELLGDPNWPGEYLLDISTRKNRAALAAISKKWIRRCAKAGFDAIEPDNLDSWTRSDGLLRKRHAVKLSTKLVRLGHRAGLAVAQKNAVELVGKRDRVGWDFAIVEDCQRYDECTDVISAYGDAVLAVEYRQRDFQRACANHGAQISVVLRDRQLVPAGTADYRYDSC